MSENSTRILALDPTTKGLGYVVFEDPFHLVEWGLALVVKGDKNAGAVLRFEEFLARFRPDVVVMEDVNAPGSKRHTRVRDLIATLTKLAKARGIPVHFISRKAVIARFSGEEKRATKYSIAEKLAEHFPQVQAKLPRRRKTYESEKERMAIFDALALAVTYATR